LSKDTPSREAPHLRRIALDVLFGVEHDLLAEDLLARAFQRDSLEKIDRAFLHEAVYGTIRRRGLLDAVIAAFSTVKIGRMETRVLLALRLGAYQLLFMSRVPKSAAVNETVEAASEERSARNFCNAVLRAISDEVSFSAEETSPTHSFEVAPGRAAVFEKQIFVSEENDPVAYVAAKFSHPESLVSRWLRRFGPAETMELCRANNHVPRLYARRNSLKISREDFLAKIKSEFSDVRSVDEETVALSGGVLLSSEMLKAGEMIIQDPTAAKVAPFLAPQPGESVLDLCAAPGVKTAHIAELMRDSGRIVAVDSLQGRIRLLEENRRRLGITCIEIILADGREFARKHPGGFDRVLLDAPCSNTGVLARRVEARWRFSETGLREMAALQSELLDAAAEALKEGGTLVYSTCSIEPEENGERIESFLKSHPQFSLDESREFFPHRGVGDGGYMARLKKA
jgi:16S rRNA (cytosine967-C5)-methyltransferase